MKTKHLHKTLVVAAIAMFCCSGLHAQTAETTANKVYTAKKAVDITIDAEDDDWGVAEFDTLAFFNDNSSEAPVPASDFNVSYKVAWDETYVYIFCDVKDESKILWSDFNDDIADLHNAWNYDNVEFYFNADLTNDAESGVYGEDAIQLRFVRGTDENEKLSGDSIEFVQAENFTADGWRFETKIMWQALPGFGPEGKQVAAGDSVGFEVTAADADNADDLRETIKSWGNNTGVDNAWQNTKLFGKMKFSSETISGGSGTGISNVYNSSRVKIYPTIVNDRVNIVSPEIGTVVIYNILGSRVMEINNIVNNTTINVSRLESGAYMIVSKNQNGKTISVNKILKQ
jgi:hypothetical protein